MQGGGKEEEEDHSSFGNDRLTNAKTTLDENNDEMLKFH